MYTKLTKLQKEILVGILLGDAHLETQNFGKTFRLKIEQSVKHQAYVFHLYEIWKNLCAPNSEANVRLMKNKTKNNCGFQTLAHPCFRFYGQIFYQSEKKKTKAACCSTHQKSLNKKIVPSEVMLAKLLTPIGLAYWFMDDGSMKSKQSKGVYLNTQGFEEKEVEKVCIILKKKYNLEAWKSQDGKGKASRADFTTFRVYISGKSYETLRELIFPHLLESFYYKFPCQRKSTLKEKIVD